MNMDHSRTHDSFSDFPLLTHERYIELINLLTALSLALSQEVPGCPAAALLAEGMAILEPYCVQKYVIIYFREWHQHSPVIHKGSFDPNMVALPLLLAVVLIGALYSSSSLNRDMARGMIFLAEQFAFRDRTFVTLAAGDLLSPILDANIGLQATQAAFLMTQIGLREGTPEKRKKVRSVMFDKIITVCCPRH